MDEELDGAVPIVKPINASVDEVETQSETAEDDQQNFHSGGSSWYWCGLILFNGTVGGGLLNMPSSIASAGGFTIGLTVLLIFAILAFIADMIMVWCADLKRTHTYQETVRTLLGPWGELISAFVIFLLMFLGDVYLVVGISGMIHRVMLDLVSEEEYCAHWYYQRAFISALALLFIILPFCLVRHIDKLKYISGAAVVSIGCVVGVTINEFYVSNAHPTIPERPAVWTDVFLAIPGISIGFSNSYGVVNVYSRQKVRSLGHGAGSIGLATALTAIVYAVTSIFAILTFGAHITDNFTASFKARNLAIRLGFLAYTLKLCFEFPVVEYVGWTCLETFLKRFIPEGHLQRFGEYKRRVAISILWVAFTYLLATLWQGLNYFAPFLSALVLATVLILPGACLLQGVELKRGESELSHSAFWGLQCLAIGLIAIGVFLIGVVLAHYGKTIAHINTGFRVC